MTTTTLIERLRTDAIFDNSTLGNEAANEIERLQARVKELEAQASKSASERDSMRQELAAHKAANKLALEFCKLMASGKTVEVSEYHRLRDAAIKTLEALK